MALATHSRRTRPLLACLLALVLGLFACRSDEEKLTDFMQRGDGFKEAEQYNEAIIEYRNVLQIDPNHAAAHEALAEAYMRTQQFKQGYWELSETVRLDPDNVEARLAYATISLAANRHQDVLEQAEAVIELDPENAPSHLLRGQSLAALERMDEVEPELLRAVELEPEDGSYRVVLAAFYNQLGRHEDAEQQLILAIEVEPEALAYMMLGRIYQRDERFDEAERAFKDSLAAALEPTEEGTERTELLQSYQNLASFYFQREQPEQGVAVLRQGIESLQGRAELVNLLARYYRSQGENEKLDSLLQEATQFDPSNPDPYLVVSNLRSRSGDLEGALEAAEAALAVSPDYVPAQLRKAELLIDMGVRASDSEMVQQGREIVDAELADNPSSPDALFVRAKVFIATNEYESGIDDLRGAIDARPDWAQAHFVLGSALLLNDERQRARAELARSVELDPGLIEARKLLVKIHFDLGEHEYAIENGQRYLRARPDDDTIRILVAQSLVRLGKLDDASEVLNVIAVERRGVDANYALGRLALAKKNIDEARTLLLEADAERPGNPKILAALLGVDRRDGKLSHSIKRINDAVEQNPENAELWQLKGSVSLIINDLPAAEAAFKKSIGIDPNSMEAYRNLARLYAATGRLDQTITLYENAAEIQPENASTHHFLGVLYEMTGQREGAEKQYELALQYDDRMSETKNNLAYLIAESGGDLDRALKLAQEAKAAMPDSANAADTLGWVLYKRGVASAAVGYLRESVQLAGPDNPSVGEIRAHLSLAYEATGDRDSAIETLETALANLERQKQGGKLTEDPPWAAMARTNIERLKSAG